MAETWRLAAQEPTIVIDVDRTLMETSSTDDPATEQRERNRDHIGVVLASNEEGDDSSDPRQCSTFSTSKGKAPTVSFHNLHYYVEVGKSKPRLEILKGISGVYGGGEGELIAIMGQSGAGKTTLLNILAQRASGEVEGRVIVNGAPLRRSNAKKLIGYIHQNDEHFPELTVFETLLFMAGLTMPASTASERHERVLDVMACLNLAQVCRREGRWWWGGGVLELQCDVGD
ncbi:hypothetical protein PTSG_10664 [Salpingoeca rosetta]|uniref:ABC transporter domain-containing protein n=1 Tax=Salpingoeca rosetta (strain ATCC 50818 / BSB-021) TaxID=946362 RepID=F2UQ12_SALR5|nr:uncharacterized protein PTSG_10664 [Salpingoeca rosetta]EGD79680.1 hypothetical protein PTSG_10664 [Salpingoeca rosetta]|eukprot:XP_004988630.1 hypothetical protein PTSG_10664 [Salpingoeca rosetta]